MRRHEICSASFPFGLLMLLSGQPSIFNIDVGAVPFNNLACIDAWRRCARQKPAMPLRSCKGAEGRNTALVDWRCAPSQRSQFQSLSGAPDLRFSLPYHPLECGLQLGALLRA